MTAGSHIPPRNSNSRLNTLSLDFGGTRVKSTILDRNGYQQGPYLAHDVPYPFAPEDMVDIVAEHAEKHQKPCDRISIGMPGIVRGGVVIHTPHYIRESGPGTTINPELAAAWERTRIARLIEERMRMPALVVNDAIITAAAVITGIGSELVLTLGTGLGVAFAVNGAMTEHIEISHAPSPLGGTFDDVAGAINFTHIDTDTWSANITKLVAALWPMYRWDNLFIGGGNSAKLNADSREYLHDMNAHFIDYESGARGGAAAWHYVASRR